MANNVAKLLTLVAHDRLGCTTLPDQALQHLDDVATGQATPWLAGQTLAAEVVDHVEDAKPSTIGHRIGHEIHRPALVDAHWKCGDDSHP